MWLQWYGKAQLVLLPVWRVNEANSSCVYIGSSSPAWKRGSPLAPVVVVGEGQVNLVYGRRLRAMAKVSKALWLISIDFDDESNRSPVAFPVAIRLRNSHVVNSRATGRTYRGAVVLLTSVEAGCTA